jgi:transglutaminase-like putative cysteine protease
MSNLAVLKATLALPFLYPTLSPTQTVAKKDAVSQDFSKESVVIDKSTSKVVFQNDGTYTNEVRVRVRIQSEAGVRQYGVLTFPYQVSDGNVEIQDVRVIKPDGTVVLTSPESVQEETSEISRLAPMYTDMREKHLPVKGLQPGDTLEYSVRFSINKPLIPGQFWISCQFVKNLVALDEEAEISIPREREIKLKSQAIQPAIRTEGNYRIYTWKRSNLVSQTLQQQKEAQSYDAMRGLLPPPDVLISTFRTWEEVGQWYQTLQREKIQPSPEVMARAAELTKGLTDDDAKVRAIYDYVSLHYRYISIGFGVGRYQPHAATDILGNQYGDCKDKHTLLGGIAECHRNPSLSSLNKHADDSRSRCTLPRSVRPCSQRGTEGKRNFLVGYDARGGANRISDQCPPRQARTGYYAGQNFVPDHARQSTVPQQR